MSDTSPSSSLSTPQYLRWVETRTLEACQRLADRDTKDSAADAFSFICSKLSSLSLPVFISCLSYMPPNAPSMCFRVQVTVLQETFEKHPDLFTTDVFLKSLSILLKRLSDNDEQTTTAVSSAMFALTSTVLLPHLHDNDDAWSLSLILRPLFSTMSDGNRTLQEGATDSLIAVFKASGKLILTPILPKLVAKLLKFFKTPSFYARANLSSAVSALISISSEDLFPFLSPIISCLVSCTHDRGWKVRFSAVEAIGLLPEYLGKEVACYYQDVATVLKNLKSDKIKNVREIASTALMAFEAIKDFSGSMSSSQSNLIVNSPPRRWSISSAYFETPSKNTDEDNFTDSEVSDVPTFKKSHKIEIS
ncbi:hypothetical protein GEMRC1_012887 [Eukaryota sp. GEM-RC1]